MDKKEPKLETMEVKPSKKPRAKKEPQGEYLIDWKAAADAIEAELKEKGWDSAHQRRNPRFTVGLVLRHIVRPLVRAIHQRG